HHLAFDEIAPERRQFSKGGPNLGCSSSQRSRRGKEREKHATATSRHGVVGSNGRTAPAAANPTITIPTAVNRWRLVAFTADSLHPSSGGPPLRAGHAARYLRTNAPVRQIPCGPPRAN